MDAETLDIHEATATTAKCNIDYIRVNDCLGKVLQDVEDIMMNQMSDMFQLSDWMIKVINIFELKICSKNEWDCFSNYYNRNTGEMINYEQPYETIEPTHNTPYPDMTKDKLLKAHAELSTTQYTIKNLLEAVVNFSHTNNITTQPQEEAETTQPPTPKQTALQANTSSGPRWVKLANLMVLILHPPKTQHQTHSSYNQTHHLSPRQTPTTSYYNSTCPSQKPNIRMLTWLTSTKKSQYM